VVETTDVGQLQRIKIMHNGHTAAQGWHLRNVRVTHTRTGEQALFICGQVCFCWRRKRAGDARGRSTACVSEQRSRGAQTESGSHPMALSQWLDKTKGDGETMRELVNHTLERSESAAQREKAAEEPRAVEEEEEEEAARAEAAAEAKATEEAVEGIAVEAMVAEGTASSIEPPLDAAPGAEPAMQESRAAAATGTAVPAAPISSAVTASVAPLPRVPPTSDAAPAPPATPPTAIDEATVTSPAESPSETSVSPAKMASPRAAPPEILSVVP
jgi:hypothetical protein